jgi:hypothetical protein
MDFLKALEPFGFAGVVTAVLFYIVWRMLSWVMTFIREMRLEHNAERKIWHELDTAKAMAIANLIDSIKRHDEKAEERGRFVREEHKEFSRQNAEICSALGRINGYKEN